MGLLLEGSFVIASFLTIILRRKVPLKNYAPALKKMSVITVLLGLVDQYQLPRAP